MASEPPVAFASSAPDPPALEVRVNFGVFAGREATPAELDELGWAVMAEFGHVTIVSEQPARAPRPGSAGGSSSLRARSAPAF